MDSNPPTTANIISVFIGTILGAGFASGQEIMQFFLRYGSKGRIGLLIAGIILFFATYSIVGYSRRQNLTGYNELFRGTPIIGKLVDIYMSIYTFFLIGVMLAGAGSLFNTLTSQPNSIGIVFIIIISFFSCIIGKNKVYKLLGKIILAAIILILFISICIISKGTISTVTILTIPKIPWYTASIIFVSNNIIALIVVLVPLGGRINDRKKALLSTGLASSIVMLTAFACLTAMNRSLDSIISTQIPMVPLAFSAGFPLGIIYSVVIFVAIYTTIICCTSSLCDRLSRLNTPLIYNHWVLIVLLSCSLLGRYSFSFLIRTVYSVSGVIGFITIIAMFTNVIMVHFGEKT